MSASSMTHCSQMHRYGCKTPAMPRMILAITAEADFEGQLPSAGVERIGTMGKNSSTSQELMHGQAPCPAHPTPPAFNTARARRQAAATAMESLLQDLHHNAS